MGDFRKAQPEAIALFQAASEGLEGEAKLMFGCPCRFVKGNMVAGTYADRVFFRVPREGQAALVAANPSLRPFEPVKGRPMGDYLEAEAAGLGPAALRTYLEAAFAYAQGLPAKVAKAKKTRKA